VSGTTFATALPARVHAFCRDHQGMHLLPRHAPTFVRSGRKGTRFSGYRRRE
jgi:hypothetical protein